MKVKHNHSPCPGTPHLTVTLQDLFVLSRGCAPAPCPILRQLLLWTWSPHVPVAPPMCRLSFVCGDKGSVAGGGRVGEG